MMATILSESGGTVGDGGGRVVVVDTPPSSDAGAADESDITL